MMKGKRKKAGILVGAAALVLLAVISICSAVTRGNTEVTYRETKVESGILAVGIEESGSVDIGTVDQVFELDMSALQRTDTDSADNTDNSGGFVGVGGAAFDMGSSASGNSLNMFDQLLNMAKGESFASGSDSSLTVSRVCVSPGQQVSAGDVLYELEEESVSKLKEELKSNVEKAKADLDAVYADQTLSRQKASYTYKSSVAYGTYADTEYSSAIDGLQQTVAEREKLLEQAKASLAEYEQQLEETNASYEKAEQMLENCEWSRDNADKWESTYNYVYYFQLAQSAQSTADTLKQKKDKLEQNVEQAQQNVETAQQAYQAAKRDLEQGKLTAKETRSLRQLAYSTAQETYDLALAYLEKAAKEQEETYQETLEKWEEYSSHIKGNTVCAQYNGVITSVGLEEGDTIHTNDTLITLYDMDDVTMTVPVDEADIKEIAEGSPANLSFTAYPDTVFQGIVTEISDAVSDSDGNVTYDVTVTLSGDVSGLFQGMTGDITFITRESENVLYVSNRAIIREGVKSYVKVKNDIGKIEKREITTGFSDGVNVEILEGLSEGDIVLIESKVSKT